VSEFVANTFSLAIAVFSFLAASMYGLIIFRRMGPGAFRFLSWFSFLLALWTGFVFTWIYFFLNTPELRAQYDIGPNLTRPIVLLFVALLVCQGMVRLFSPRGPRV
jgi:hypothetical protein